MRLTRCTFFNIFLLKELFENLLCICYGASYQHVMSRMRLTVHYYVDVMISPTFRHLIVQVC